MRILCFCFLLLIGLIGGDVSAGEIKEVELNDGSIICGEIVSLMDGVYTLKSVSLGTIKVEESKVRSVTPIETTREQSQALQKLMMDDKEILAIILSLQDDSDIKAVIEDPAIMKAINSGDMEYLISSPKFIKLLNNPKIRDIREKVIK